MVLGFWWRHMTLRDAPRFYWHRYAERLGVYVWNKWLVKSELGLLPKTYNYRIHGPYCPWRYYGTPDTPLSQVKLKDLRSWMGRRDMSFHGTVGVLSRFCNLWMHRYRDVRYPSMAFFFQWLVFFYLLNYYLGWIHYIKYMQFHEYHW